VRNTTLPLIKYGVQYIRSHLKFIWSAPNYFIIQPLGGRLTSCKMVANGEEKAFCVLHFHVSRSVLTVKREFRTRCKKEPPAKNSIRSWYDNFQRTDCLCKGKLICKIYQIQIVQIFLKGPVYSDYVSVALVI